ncbi:hypothetical protein CJF30_00010113 [Rutstroemia sp. NJR-2017a BBW]|nr:hypothetical protein CJF30_00010113 [Rutstroemia sp. NJR-2017a BBW]
MSSAIYTVTCHCLHCKSVLGTFENSWEGIGKTYIIPSVVRSAVGLKGTGPIKQANAPVQVGTPVENRMQLARHVTPNWGYDVMAHPSVIYLRNQYLLCSKLMWITSDATGEKAALVITKTHALKNPANASKITLQKTSMLGKTPLSSKATSKFTPAHHTTSLLAKTPLSSKANPKLNHAYNPLTAASPAVSTDSTVLAISEQRKDIDRIDAAVNRLENDMLELKSFMGEMRQKLEETRPSRSRQNSPILGDISEAAEQSGDLPSVELKTREVDELRAELRLIQNRMEELENSNQPASLRPTV